MFFSIIPRYYENEPGRQGYRRWQASSGRGRFWLGHMARDDAERNQLALGLRVLQTCWTYSHTLVQMQFAIWGLELGGNGRLVLHASPLSPRDSSGVKVMHGS